MRRLAFSAATVARTTEQVGVREAGPLNFRLESLGVEGRAIVARGLLENPTDAELRVVTASGPLGIYFMAGPRWAGPPRPPPCPVPPIEISIPPATALELEAHLWLSGYAWEGTPTVNVAWLCGYCKTPYPNGIVPVRLPPFDE